MTAASTDVVLRLRPDAVSWREVDGEVIALDLRAGDYLAVNATGATLWRALEHGIRPADLVELLVERCNVTRDRSTEDVVAFTGQLDDRGLLARGHAS